ncbi:MAG: hypothetical protein SWH61_02855 [Thermodesulfobacteriota bacterium]|nr:hypothetical protein [Thermodesulfobacteriota bacterium]
MFNSDARVMNALKRRCQMQLVMVWAGLHEPANERLLFLLGIGDKMMEKIFLQHLQSLL